MTKCEKTHHESDFSRCAWNSRRNCKEEMGLPATNITPVPSGTAGY